MASVEGKEHLTAGCVTIQPMYSAEQESGTAIGNSLPLLAAVMRWR